MVRTDPTNADEAEPSPDAAALPRASLGAAAPPFASDAPRGGPVSGVAPRIELSDRLAELTRALQKAEALNQLTAGIAHDVLNTLQVIMGEADKLTATLDEPAQLDSAQAVLLAARHAGELTRDLLHLARKQRGAAAALDTGRIMQESRRLIESLVPKHIRCTFTLDPELWPVEAEPQELEAALINLSTNARDAMPRGGRLQVTARNLPAESTRSPDLPPGDCVSFRVEDSGKGMSPEVRARATEAFFTTKGDAGTGLGLALVEAFALRARGALHIESAVGRGTCVELVLPRARPVRPGSAGSALHAFPSLQQIAERAHTDWLQDVLEQWAQACPAEGLPQTVALETALAAYADDTVWLAVDRHADPVGFRLVHMGDNLAALLKRCAVADPPRTGGEILGDLGDAYRRALSANGPSYDYVRYDLGDGAPVEFERLILPAALDGKVVSHLIGVVVFKGAVCLGD